MRVRNVGPNHNTIEHQGVNYLQSYESIIARWVDGERPLFSPHWDYSKTTMKYLGQFLNSNAKEIRQKFKDGEYVVGIDTEGNLLNG